MLVKFEQNRMVQTTRNFWQNPVFFFTNPFFWQSFDAILEDVSVVETIV